MTPLHRDFSEKMIRAQLHLVDGKGTPLSPAVQSACETAYQRVIRDHPDFDRAQLANWAEEVGVFMESRVSMIPYLRRYAHARLEGKLRDWSRTAAGRTELKGIGADLEPVGELSEAFVSQLERKILFGQIATSLNARDRAILVLLLRDKSTADIAAFINTNYAAAAKAIQRVKDRGSVTANGRRRRIESERDAGSSLVKGIGSESRANEGFPSRIFSKSRKKGLSR